MGVNSLRSLRACSSKLRRPLRSGPTQRGRSVSAALAELEQAYTESAPYRRLPGWAGAVAVLILASAAMIHAASAFELASRTISSGDPR
jgi:hypothetical protein